MNRESKWHHKAGYDFAVAGVMFATPENWLIMHHRDGNTPFSTNLLSFFGGHLEDEDDTPAHGAAREASEETNRVVTVADIEPFMEYTFKIRPDRTERIYLYVLRNQTTEGLEIYEGQGYKVINSPDDPLIAPVVRAPVEKWFNNHSTQN